MSSEGVRYEYLVVVFENQRIRMKINIDDDEAPILLFDADSGTPIETPPEGSFMRMVLNRELVHWLVSRNIELSPQRKTYLQ